MSAHRHQRPHPREHIRVREGDPLDLRRARAAQGGAVEEMYREKGYRFAEVRYSLEDGHRRTRAGRVHRRRGRPGPDRRHRVRGQRGLRRPPPALDDEEDQGERPDLPDPEEGHLQPGDAGRGPRQGPRPLPRRRLQERASRRAAARGAGARPERTPPSAEQKRRLFLDIPIDEGERWKLRRHHDRGQRDATPTSCCSRRSAAAGRLAALQGHRRRRRDDRATSTATPATSSPEVDPELVERPRATVADVVVHVDEGDQFQVGRHRVRGQRPHQDKVLRREFRLHEGMVLNMGGAQEQPAQDQPARVTSSSTRTTRSSSELRQREEDGRPGGQGRRSRTAPSSSSAAAGASSTASSASSRSAPRTSSAAARRSASRSASAEFADESRPLVLRPLVPRPAAERRRSDLPSRPRTTT